MVSFFGMRSRRGAASLSTWIQCRARRLPFVATLLAVMVLLAAALRPDSFVFIIIGDRTGGTQPGVYEQVWQEAAAEHPAFVVSVGDTIEGLNDATAEAQWSAVEQILT